MCRSGSALDELSLLGLKAVQELPWVVLTGLTDLTVVKVITVKYLEQKSTIQKH